MPELDDKALYFSESLLSDFRNRAGGGADAKRSKRNRKLSIFHNVRNLMVRSSLSFISDFIDNNF